VFPRWVVVGDVSVIHPAAASYAGGAASTPGFAAAAWDASKLRAYRQVSSTLPFVPMSVASFGLNDPGPGADRGLGGPFGADWRAWPLSGCLHLGGAPGAQPCPLPGQRVPVSVVRHDACLWLDPDARSCLALGRDG
jgi:hypothetical protein